MMTLYDGRSELWQWDTGRTLAVDADCSQVHFSNKVFGRSIDVDVTDGVAIIPDVLLQTDKELNIWAFVGTADNGYTKISKTFKVNRRNKPADYVFTPVEQTTIAEIAAIAQSVRDDADAGLFDGAQGPEGPAGKDGVQIDDAAVSEDAPWSSKHIVDMLCPPLEESGNPVVCYPVVGYPLGVKAKWEPTQEGSGAPSPDNVRPIKGMDSVTVERCGENLIKFPYSIPTASRNGLVITSQQDGSMTVNGTPTSDTWFLIEGGIETRLPMNTPLTLSGCPAGGTIKSYYIGLYLGGKWYTDTGNGNTNIKFTTREIASRIEISIVKGTVCNNLTFYPKIEVGTTITPYSKYQGSTNTLTLPETVYGGEVDAVTGEGQKMWKMLTLDGTEEWFKYGSVSEKAPASCFSCHINDKDIGFGTSVCNKFENTKNSNPFYNEYMKKFTYTDHPDLKSIYMNYGDDQTVPLDEWKSYLAAQYASGTPVQICYKLAEPVPFTATGAQTIPALAGVNTIYTDADGVVVTGAEDPKHTITELKNAIISLGGNI